MGDGAGERLRDGAALQQGGIVALAMCVFGLFVRTGAPLALVAAAGLTTAAVVVWRSLDAEAAALSSAGFRLPRRPVVPFMCVGLVLGLALGVFCRARYGLAALPGELRPFAAVAVAIGAAEEALYRGWLQGRFRALTPAAAVVAAALAHSAYKCGLFVLAPAQAEVSLLVLGFWTLVGGLAFGALREASGSVLPPLLAHAVFDVVVYGELARAPWWVW